MYMSCLIYERIYNEHTIVSTYLHDYFFKILLIKKLMEKGNLFVDLLTVVNVIYFNKVQ